MGTPEAPTSSRAFAPSAASLASSVVSRVSSEGKASGGGPSPEGERRASCSDGRDGVSDGDGEGGAEMDSGKVSAGGVSCGRAKGSGSGEGSDEGDGTSSGEYARAARAGSSPRDS